MFAHGAMRAREGQINTPFARLPPSVKPGVVTGKALLDLLSYAKKEGFAIPAVNCISSSSINQVCAVLLSILLL
jgi:hypothetical protein